MNRFTFAIAGFLLTISQTQAAMLPGAKAKDWPADPTKHVVTIKRTGANAIEKAMIAKAEAAKPSSGQWWIVGEGNKPMIQLNTRLPFAITGDAIKYYSEKVQGYGKKKHRSFMQPSSSLSYTATVTTHEPAVIDAKVKPPIYTVKLTLKYRGSFVEDSTTAIEIDKTRTVQLDADGNVLSISGDNTNWGAMLAI